MVIIKEGLYRLLSPVGVMPAGLFLTLVKNKFVKGFNILPDCYNSETTYTDLPVELVKEFVSEV